MCGGSSPTGSAGGRLRGRRRHCGNRAAAEAAALTRAGLGAAGRPDRRRARRGRRLHGPGAGRRAAHAGHGGRERRKVASVRQAARRSGEHLPDRITCTPPPPPDKKRRAREARPRQHKTRADVSAAPRRPPHVERPLEHGAMSTVDLARDIELTATSRLDGREPRAMTCAPFPARARLAARLAHRTSSDL